MVIKLGPADVTSLSEGPTSSPPPALGAVAPPETEGIRRGLLGGLKQKDSSTTAWRDSLVAYIKAPVRTELSIILL